MSARKQLQKSGLNATRGIRALVWIQVLLVLAGLIVGSIAAVELHTISSLPSGDPFGSLGRVGVHAAR